MAAPFWQLGPLTLDLTVQTRIMGVVNVTPDSFSDGGQHHRPELAIAHGRLLADQGADILDIGGESTRPGADPVPEAEERERVIPVLRGLREALPDMVLSIDTCKSTVAEAAVQAGANLVNDVTAGLGDPDMMAVVAASGAGYLLMHMQGTPRTMQDQPQYQDVIGEVRGFLEERIAAAEAAGIHPAGIGIDPGIGFGKTLEHNLGLLAGLESFHGLGRALVMGVSRKRWIGDLTGRPVDQRLAGSLAGAAACLERGAQVLRVHDVAETRDVVCILDRIRQTSAG